METDARAKRQAPLKVDPETDELISQGAHFLGMTKKDLVAEAVRPTSLSVARKSTTP